MRISRITLLFMIGVIVAQTIHYYPNLPEIMASHFAGAGKPDGWMSKRAFFILESVILLLVVGNSSFLWFIIPQIPDRFINIPNRNYWLTPNRRHAALIKLELHFEWFGVILLGLFILVNQLVIAANLSNENLSSAKFVTILISFFICLAIWSVALYKGFRIPNE